MIGLNFRLVSHRHSIIVYIYIQNSRNATDLGVTGGANIVGNAVEAFARVSVRYRCGSIDRGLCGVRALTGMYVLHIYILHSPLKDYTKHTNRNDRLLSRQLHSRTGNQNEPETFIWQITNQLPM